MMTSILRNLRIHHDFTSLRALTTGGNIVSKSSNTTPMLSEERDKLYSKLEIEIRGVDPAVLKSYSWFATTAANHLDIEVGKCYSARKASKERLTLLKCVHIYKKHRVQYEIRTYFRYMNFHKLTESTLDTFLEYIERNLPEGVALLATRTEIQEIPEHLRQPPNST
uniref:Small ribosomal subunit protein uS10m n=1 Tax=Glossina morsitans morsitans TaxID=37546 RepID=A0A1B0FBF4_GLOMM